MPKLSPLLILPPLLFIGLAAMFMIGMQRENPNDLPSAFLNRPAPPVTDRALTGIPGIAPGDLATGEVVIVNFWASWCPPCRAEHPTLHRLAEEGLPVFGVNFADEEDKALQYLRDEGNPFRAIAFDPQRRTAIEWGVSAPPETFILDGEGRVVYKFIGPLVGSDLEQRFLPELAKARAATVRD